MQIAAVSPIVLPYLYTYIYVLVYTTSQIAQPTKRQQFVWITIVLVDQKYLTSGTSPRKKKKRIGFSWLLFLLQEMDWNASTTEAWPLFPLAEYHRPPPPKHLTILTTVPMSLSWRILSVIRHGYCKRFVLNIRMVKLLTLNTIFKFSVAQNKKVYWSGFWPINMGYCTSHCIFSRHPTFWKSTKRDLLVSSVNLCLFAQTGFLQIVGCVYLNCCSTSLTTDWQSIQRNVPLTSSGCTGWVLTTCPVMRSNVPIFKELSSRTLQEIHKQIV